MRSYGRQCTRVHYLILTCRNRNQLASFYFFFQVFSHNSQTVKRKSTKAKSMAFSRWFSRMRATSKTIFTHLQTTHTTSRANTVSKVTSSSNRRNPFLWWSSYLVPISATSLMLQIQPTPSFSDAFDPNARSVSHHSHHFIFHCKRKKKRNSRRKRQLFSFFQWVFLCMYIVDIGALFISFHGFLISFSKFQFIELCSDE